MTVMMMMMMMMIVELIYSPRPEWIKRLMRGKVNQGHAW